MSDQADGAARRTAWTAGALFLGLFGLYAYTAAPEVTFHDSGELITAAQTLGIAHPPGSPTWCLLGHLFTLIPFGSPAYRVHLMSGFFAALTGVFVLLIVMRLLRDCAMPAWWKRVAGVVGALSLAQTTALWEKAVQAELYTMNAWFLLAIVYLFLVWLDREGRNDPRHREALSGMACLFGLGAGNYLAILYYTPVFVIAVLWRRPAIWREFRLIAWLAFVFVLSFGIYLYLPLRSMANPALDWGNPETWNGFVAAMRRERWGALSLTSLAPAFLAEWMRSMEWREQFGLAGLALSLVGAFVAGRRQKAATLVLVGCFCAYALFMGYMQAATPCLTQDLAYVTTYGMLEFHIPLYTIASVFAGVGFGGAGSALADVLARRARVPWLRAALGGVGLAAGLAAVAARFDLGDYRSFRHAYAFGQEVLRAIPQNAWVFAGSDNNMFVLMYLRFCRNERPDITLVTPTLDHAYVEALGSRAAKTNDALTLSWAVNLLRGNLEKYTEPLLNQGKSFGEDPPCLAFVKFPYSTPLARSLYPDGLVFRLDNRERYDKARQTAYWKRLLEQPFFALDAGAKHDYRENMMNLLLDHAWWHGVNGEYDVAKYLYGEAERYAPVARPDILAGLADSMLELGELDQAFEAAKRALRLDPANRTALNLLGIVCARWGRYEVAASCFEAILKQDPQDGPARENLRRVREKMVKTDR